tara:strand:+ start:99 stop:410 length:312 start_codon:yes stop_codon:yes gene_type:complete
MSVKIAVLNSGTQILADIKEVTDGDIRSYLLIKPFEIIYTTDIKFQEEKNSAGGEIKKVGLRTWMEISEDDTYIMNPSTVSVVCEPVGELREMYENLTHGRRE